LRQDSIITALYRREGFVFTGCRDYNASLRGLCDSVVDVRINAGDYYRLKNIEITGNRAKSAFSIKRNMRSWLTSIMPGSAGRFVRSVYSEDIEKCLERYRKSGYADISVHDTLIIDSAAKSVKAVLTINEGDKYVLKCSRAAEEV
jgi:outer membrane protein assembly factor BamA